YYAQYLYLQRVRDASVVLEAIRDGVARLTWETETFAYADGWDETNGRYLGLRTSATGNVTAEGGTLVVKPETARRQRDAEEAARQASSAPGDAPVSSRPRDERDMPITPDHTQS